MKKTTITTRDSMGFEVHQPVEMLEPHDYGEALDRITLDFQQGFRKLVDRNLDVTRFMFVFRAEKDADGNMVYDRFFIDQQPPQKKGETP